MHVLAILTIATILTAAGNDNIYPILPALCHIDNLCCMSIIFWQHIITIGLLIKCLFFKPPAITYTARRLISDSNFTCLVKSYLPNKGVYPKLRW